ncbi:MAG: response regulator [Planctomycetes bacterium]|nr:response regulator [Planctomycetota bacterium]
MSRDKNTVLVVDANPQAIQNLQNLLKGYEFVLLWAPDVVRAHAILRSRDISCVLVESEIGEMSSIDFLAELRDNEKKAQVPKPSPVVLLVGDTSAQMVLRAKELNVTEILIKPVTATRLRKALAKALFAKQN